jgi:hypothetical protein
MAKDAPEFMLDEDMTISLTGTNPTVSMGDHGMRVESGTLLMTSTSTQDVIVEAGMCIDMGDDEGSEDDRRDMGMEERRSPENDEENDEENDGDEHPFSEMKAASCD